MVYPNSYKEDNNQTNYYKALNNTMHEKDLMKALKEKSNTTAISAEATYIINL